MNFSKVYDILNERGISMRQVCRDTKISTSTMYKLSRGQGVSTETIEKLCLYLGVSVKDIATRDKKESPREDENTALKEYMEQLMKLAKELEEEEQKIEDDTAKVMTILTKLGILIDNKSNQRKDEIASIRRNLMTTIESIKSTMTDDKVAIEGDDAILYEILEDIEGDTNKD